MCWCITAPRSWIRNSRRLWLSEIRCWRSFPANFDAAGKFFTDFPAAPNAIPAKDWAFSGKESGCWKIGPAFRNTPGFSPLKPPQPSWVSLNEGKPTQKKTFWRFSCSFLRTNGWKMSKFVDVFWRGLKLFDVAPFCWNFLRSAECRRARVFLTKWGARNLGEIPPKIETANPLFWSVSGGGETLWDLSTSSLPLSLWIRLYFVHHHFPSTWADSEGHPNAEGTFTAGTLVNVTEVLVNMALWVRQNSPNFAGLRQSSHEGACMLPVHPGTCLIYTVRKPDPWYFSLPKRPSCKNTTESEFWWRENIRYGRSKTLRRGLRHACSSTQKRRENGTESENYGGSKILWIWAPYYFSTEGSFGWLYLFERHSGKQGQGWLRFSSYRLSFLGNLFGTPTVAKPD